MKFIVKKKSKYKTDQHNWFDCPFYTIPNIL